MSEIKILICIVCGHSILYSDAIAKRMTGCPMCKTKISPMSKDDTVRIDINWSEIRLFAIYAQRWMMQFDLKNPANMEYAKSVERIVRYLSLYKPKGCKDLDPNMEIIRNDKGEIAKEIQSPYF